MHVEHKHPKPTASCEAAPLWASNSPPLILFREAGQMYQVKGVCNMPIEMAMPKIEYKPYAHHDDN